MIDTIVAQSTAPGIGALAVVRLSGPRALAAARRLCPGLPEAPEPRKAYLSDQVDPEDGELLDRGLVTWFRGPSSYTGEDLVEISCHGGWLAPGLVVEAACAAGCRRAEPGEFSRRAYLNGKMDLVQVEAVLDLVEARSPALRRAALSQLDRGLSGRVAALRGDLVHLEALLAHHIDFPEEDDAPVAAEVVAGKAREVLAALDALLATVPEGQLLRDGAVTVLAGLPNAGKSSLFNALLGQERAIVTEHAGTTRDAIEATVSLGGFPFRLVDTAGIRETDAPVERLGVEVARRYLDRADLVLLCVDGQESGGGAVVEAFVRGLDGVPVVRVRTKADLGAGVAEGEGAPEGRAGNGRDPAGWAYAADVAVSAVSGQGLDVLRDTLPRLVYSGLVHATPEAPVLTRPRHAAALRKARTEVAAFEEAVAGGVPAEMAATHLRPAETALEELLGTITADDVLDRVFRDFCIGK